MGAMRIATAPSPAACAGRPPLGARPFFAARRLPPARAQSNDRFNPRLNMFKHLKDDGIGPAISTEEFWDVIMEAQQEGAKQEREQEPGLPRRPEDWAPPSPEEAAMSLRMGSWRLKGRVHPQLEALVAQVEAAWRGSFHGDFKLFLTPLRLKFRDSVDPDQENPASYGDVIDPAADGPGFPRFMLESRAYRTRVFRKCLLHLTHRQDDSQVWGWMSWCMKEGEGEREGERRGGKGWV